MTGKEFSDNPPYVTVTLSLKTGRYSPCTMRWSSRIEDYEIHSIGPGSYSESEAHKQAKDLAASKQMEYKP